MSENEQGPIRRIGNLLWRKGVDGVLTMIGHVGSAAASGGSIQPGTLPIRVDAINDETGQFNNWRNWIRPSGPAQTGINFLSGMLNRPTPQGEYGSGNSLWGNLEGWQQAPGMAPGQLTGDGRGTNTWIGGEAGYGVVRDPTGFMIPYSERGGTVLTPNGHSYWEQNGRPTFPVFSWDRPQPQNPFQGNGPLLSYGNEGSTGDSGGSQGGERWYTPGNQVTGTRIRANRK